MDPRPWHEFYDDGVPPSLDYEDVPLGGFIPRAAERWGDRPAIAFMNCRMTYAQLADHVARLADVLTGKGVVKDSKVAIHLPNLPQTIIAFHAVMACGAQAVMTNPLYVSREIEHQWNDAGCKLAITADFLYARTIAPIKDKLPVEQYIVTSIPDYLGFPLNLLAPLKLKRQNPPAIAPMPTGPDITPFKAAIKAAAPRRPDVSVGMDDLAVLQYTGGTTGVSKAAVLTHRNLSYNVQQCRAWMTTLNDGTDVVLAALPYFHIFGLTVCMNMCVWLGANIVVMPNPRDIPALIKATAKHRVTLFPGVPAMFHNINVHPMAAKADMSSVKGIFSGSAPLPIDTMKRFEALTGGIIIEAFGLTETSPGTHVNPMFGTRKPGTVGLPISDTDSRIVDMDDGVTDMPVGQEGELIIKGPQVMQGYWNRPDETALVLKDGWLYTGDLAIADEQGYVSIVGRKKDMIVCGGYNVYPDEIDRVLTDHEDVLEAATIGIPDPKRGETVKSFVVRRPGSALDEAGVVAWCKEQLAAYKVPKLVEFRDELPKSAMLKLLRRELRDQEIARMEAEGGA